MLSRKGIYVMETDEVAVTATVLTQTAPFRLVSSLAYEYLWLKLELLPCNLT